MGLTIATQSTFCDDILRSGMPNKCGVLTLGKQRKFSSGKKWKRRFLAINRGQLNVYSVGLNILKTYSLEQSQISVTATARASYEFEIRNAKTKLPWLFLKSTTQENRLAWVSALRRESFAGKGRQARDKLLSAIECMSSQLPSLEIQVIDHKGVLRLEQERISTIASQLRISKTASRELLNAVNWNVEDIKPSLVNTTSSNAMCDETPSSPSECGICLECNLNLTQATTCNHSFCAGCWNEHVGDAVAHGAQSCCELSCPACKKLLSQEFIFKFLNEQQQKRYLHMRQTQFVRVNNKQLRRCPSARCDLVWSWSHADQEVLRRSQAAQLEVLCGCGDRYCFGCNQLSHAPATCDQRRQWMLLCESKKNGTSIDAKDAEWIKKNCTTCPKCGETATRNKGGCNHMTCFCGYEFCFVCLGQWEGHDMAGGFFRCNVADAAEQKKTRLAELGVSTLRKDNVIPEHFTGCHQEYVQNLDIRLAWVSRIRDKILELFDQRNGWTGEGFDQLRKTFEKALKVVVRCRKVLAWSAVFGYFIHDSIMNELLSGLKSILAFEIDRLQETIDCPLNFRWNCVAKKELYKILVLAARKIAEQTQITDEMRKRLIAASTDTQLTAAQSIAPHERAMPRSTRINRETKSEEKVDPEVDEKTCCPPHKELREELCEEESWTCCLCAYKNVPSSLREESAAVKLSPTETPAASPDNESRCSMCNSPRYSEAYGLRLYSVLSRVEAVPLPTPMSREQAQAIVKRLPPISSRLSQRIRSKEKSQRVAENTNGDATGGWYCSVCTFHNERRFNRCTMCQQGIRGM